MIPGSTIVVVSPHSDDGVLSLGASMARWARSGTAGRAADGARARSRFDGAGRRLGSPRGVRNRGRGGARTSRGGPRGVRAPRCHSRAGSRSGASTSTATETTTTSGTPCAAPWSGADCVLVPGSPLTHPDHAWLNGLLTRHVPPELLGLYAEQPYTARQSGDAVLARRRSARATDSRSGARSAPTARSFRSWACGEASAAGRSPSRSPRRGSPGPVSRLRLR